MKVALGLLFLLLGILVIAASPAGSETDVLDVTGFILCMSGIATALIGAFNDFD